jgi:hypothetical protein
MRIDEANRCFGYRLQRTRASNTTPRTLPVMDELMDSHMKVMRVDPSTIAFAALSLSLTLIILKESNCSVLSH